MALPEGDRGTESLPAIQLPDPAFGGEVDGDNGAGLMAAHGTPAIQNRFERIPPKDAVLYEGSIQQHLAHDPRLRSEE